MGASDSTVQPEEGLPDLDMDMDEEKKQLIDQLREELNNKPKTNLSEDDAVRLVIDLVKFLKTLPSYANKHCVFALSTIRSLYNDKPDYKPVVAKTLLNEKFPGM